MRAGRISTDEAVRISVYALPGAARHRCAFGVRDAGVERARGVLAAQRKLRGSVNVDFPREIEVEILLLDCHELGVGETRILVRRREAADAHGLAHRVLHARRREIRGARTALASIAIHRDRETAIALPLHGLELAHAHGHRQSFLVADADLGLVGAVFATRVIRGLLFGVAPNDPTTFIVVGLMMAVIGIVACWIPAHRAARIDPAITMRS